MKTNKSEADAKTAKVTNLQEVAKGKKFAEVQKAAKEVVDVTPIEETTPALESTPQTNPTPQPATEEQPVQIPFSMEVYKNRIEKMYELTNKHNNLTGKLREVEMFDIKRENNSANVRLADGKGISFYSNDVLSIEKTLSVIKESYTEQIKEVENQIFDLLRA